MQEEKAFLLRKLKRRHGAELGPNDKEYSLDEGYINEIREIVNSTPDTTPGRNDSFIKLVLRTNDLVELDQLLAAMEVLAERSEDEKELERIKNYTEYTKGMISQKKTRRRMERQRRYSQRS